jgi:hypothetical protein
MDMTVQMACDPLERLHESLKELKKGGKPERIASVKEAIRVLFAARRDALKAGEREREAKLGLGWANLGYKFPRLLDLPEVKEVIEQELGSLREIHDLLRMYTPRNRQRIPPRRR